MNSVYLVFLLLVVLALTTAKIVLLSVERTRGNGNELKIVRRV
ncbi:hypothetical protein DET65_1376 [Sunxiuqinia elliptica]|uniref:Uncharacterized protein n=1 Tax=Sunxiuqinia elliptica TaxID=655355 RepID=A0A4R6HBR1_9BACT|nr:hypothetical protein DET52_101817 [Sunxiuqinia elliptica]TDO65003.1 hypothetical protein DET65_1376 [Sunxiuqinia elliptica]